MKPAVLKNLLSELFVLDENKVELFSQCWTTNAEQVVCRLQQNFTHSYRVTIILLYYVFHLELCTKIVNFTFY